MDQQNARDEIVSYVTVSRQNIVLAKSFIINNFDASAIEMRDRLLEHFDAEKLDQVILDDSVDLPSQFRSVASWLGWQLAFAEAIWGLVGSGLVIPNGHSFMNIDVRQDYSDMGGRHSTGWEFDEYRTAVPDPVRKAPSLSFGVVQTLSDADLFIADLNIDDMHPEIGFALREAVECFRSELYLPSLAMLGLASEGAWIELGFSLLDSCTNQPGLAENTREKYREDLNSSYTSVLKKLEIVANLYQRKGIFGEVAKGSGFNHKALAQVLNWSNVVRDARNAIHYGTEPSSPNNYEKVAVLLLGAGQNLRILYAIMQAARES